MSEKKTVIKLQRMLNNLTLNQVIQFSKDNPDATVEFNNGEAKEIITVIMTECSANKYRLQAMEQTQQALLKQLNVLHEENQNLNDKITKLTSAKQVQTFPKLVAGFSTKL